MAKIIVRLSYLGDDLINKPLDTVTGECWPIVRRKIEDIAYQQFGKEWKYKRISPDCLYPYICCTSDIHHGDCIILE